MFFQMKKKAENKQSWTYSLFALGYGSEVISCLNSSKTTDCNLASQIRPLLP